MKYIFSIFCFIFSTILFSQSSDDIKILDELKKRNINTKEQAIIELNKNGISLDQAQEMANMQGIDLDTFLTNNFKSIGTNTEIDNVSDEIVDKIEIEEVAILDDSFVKDTVPTESNIFFGYNIFKNNPFATKNYIVGNIDEGYLLSPGDELRITVYGNNALSAVSKIDLNGNIIFPELGVFQAAGNSLKTLKQRLKLFLGKFYNGLVSNPQQAFLDISLTQIRPVSVNILGEAVTPGPHLVNGLASVLNALYSAGGVNTSGSLRRILLYRNNKLLKEFDLYDYITEGNIDQDIRLMSSDIIFIPPRLNSISLTGNIRNNAIFEIKNDETLEDLIRFSGGFNPDSSIDNINISRIKPFEERTSEEKYDRFLLTIDFTKNKSMELVDGDVISVKSILTNTLYELNLEGNVNNPGVFSLQTFPDLNSLIVNGGNGLAPNTYMGKVDVIKEDQSGNKSFKTYNLESIINKKIEVILSQGDIIRVYSNNSVSGEKLITISGFGIDNKTIFWRDNLSLFDIIFQSSSFEELEFRSDVLSSRIDVDSYDSESGNYVSNIYSLDNIIELKQIFLKPKDIIRIYSKSVTQNLNPTVIVSGNVKNISTVPLKKEMVVEDAILMAGGFETFADKLNVDIVRKLLYSKDKNLSKTIKYQIDSDYLLGFKKKPSNPFYLEDFDVVVVRKPIRDDIIATVSINGEVNRPGLYSFANYDKSLKDLINDSGGLTVYSNINSTIYSRNGQTLAYKSPSKLLKQRLSPGDEIIIGSALSDVNITGNGIINETFSSWYDGRRSKYYINKAGGTKNRIESRVIIRNNGSTKKIRRILSNPKVFPGDKIVITQKPPKEKSETTFQDEFIRIFGVITGTLTTILLIDKL